MALTKISRSLLDTGVSDSSDATAITIDSSENVGIGTTSPVAKLQIQTQTNGNAAFQNSTSATGGVKINCFNDAANASSPFELDGSTLQFNIAASEKMRIDSSGNLGIGTTSPQTKLQVATANGTLSHFGGIATTNTHYTGISLGYSEAANANYRKTAIVQEQIADGAAGGNLHFLVDTTADANSAVLADSKMMLHGISGMVYMNGATGSYGTPSFTDGILFTYKDDNEPHIENKVNHANTMGLYKFQNSNGTAGSISLYSSSVTFNTSSDYRLKEDVNYTWDAISKLEQLKPCEFKFKADSDDVIHQGFLAHEVDNIVPTSVFGEKDGTEMQQIDHSKLVPLLTKAIQELSTKLEAAEARITTLEG